MGGAQIRSSKSNRMQMMQLNGVNGETSGGALEALQSSPAAGGGGGRGQGGGGVMAWGCGRCCLIPC